MTLAIVVLISGNGSNLQAIIDAIHQGLDVEIRAVISNRAGAFGLERAKRAGIPARIIDHTQFSHRAAFETALRVQIDAYTPQLVVLAGFMRRLTANFVEHYSQCMINIHPSLLPKYPGLATHQRVLTARDTIHGVTVHYVTAEVDSGPIICQASITVEPDDTAATLEQRIHALEHKLYPQALAKLASNAR